MLQRAPSPLGLTPASGCVLVASTLIQSAARSRSPLPRAQQVLRSGDGPTVVGMGLCCMDYLAQVASYPTADAKLRTEALETKSGGNAGNQLTAAARLGIAAALVTKIGDDGIGDQMLQELHEAGVSTEHVLREQGHPSPFTYIIVDREGGTRTCIHTPGPALRQEELTQERIQALLSQASLVSFDGRLTEAATTLAAAARQRGVPVLVEAERVRPHLERLLPLADYVITSAHYPEDWTGEQGLARALQAMLPHVPHARWVITTLGSKGSVLIQRQTETDTAKDLEEADLAEVFEQLTRQSQSDQTDSGDATACTSATGVEISEGRVASTPAFVRLKSGVNDRAASEQRAKAAAEAEAKLANEAEGSASFHSLQAVAQEQADLPVKVHVATPAVLPPGAVKDTTGAGDAFIGAMQYAICKGLQPEQALKLAGVVAGCKCTAIGARAGLPMRDAVAHRLL